MFRLCSRLSVWDLSSGKLLAHATVPDDTSYLSFNPFNSQQLCTGQNKRLSVWVLGPYTQFTAPTLTQLYAIAPMHTALLIDRAPCPVLCAGMSAWTLLISWIARLPRMSGLRMGAFACACPDSPADC